VGDTERPIPERDGDQDEQAAHLVRTGNGPTVDDEQQLLDERYGPADMSGFYTRPERVDQDDAEPDRAGSTDGAAEAGDAAAADGPKGGTSA
jgi:hypothetical protein